MISTTTRNSFKNKGIFEGTQHVLELGRYHIIGKLVQILSWLLCV